MCTFFTSFDLTYSIITLAGIVLGGAAWFTLMLASCCKVSNLFHINNALSVILCQLCSSSFGLLDVASN